MSVQMLATIGRTPLVELPCVIPGRTIHAKLELFNPTGSAKDRSAASMIRAALEAGHVAVGGTVIESSSGNMGLALAFACGCHQLKFTCIVDERTSPRTTQMLSALNVRVETVREKDRADGESLLECRIRRVLEIQATIPGCYWTNQYQNPVNAAAHHDTMNEIAMAMDGRVDYCFVATSTCGTLAGCVDYARSRALRTQFIAVDAVGSVTFGGALGPRKLPGLGISIIPSLYRTDLANRVFRATELDCVVGCRRLLATEGVFAGASSGAVISAVQALSSELPEQARIAVILHDRGDRYVDTVYSDSWAREACGWNG